MHRNVRVVALVAVFLSISVGLSTGSAARNNTVLAEDFPYSVVFTAMARRGVLDYAVVNRVFPADLIEVANGGFMSYELPEGCILEYTNDGCLALLTSEGTPQIFGGMLYDPLDETICLPEETPYHTEKKGMYDEVDGKMEFVEKETCVYHYWPGAKWVADGLPFNELDTPLRFYRLWAHLCFTSEDYKDITGTMPVNLEELEAFIGTGRNPAAWSGVTLVNSFDSVEATVGALYAGRTGEGDWAISCNLGPEVKKACYSSERGNWQLEGDTYSY